MLKDEFDELKSLENKALREVYSEVERSIQISNELCAFLEPYKSELGDMIKKIHIRSKK